MEEKIFNRTVIATLNGTQEEYTVYTCGDRVIIEADEDKRTLLTDEVVDRIKKETHIFSPIPCAYNYAHGYKPKNWGEWCTIARDILFH